MIVSTYDEVFKPLEHVNQDPFMLRNVEGGARPEEVEMPERHDIDEDPFMTGDPEEYRKYMEKLEAERRAEEEAMADQYDLSNDPFMTHGVELPKPEPPPEPQITSVAKEPEPITVWYPAENNWMTCYNKMAVNFMRIRAEFTGQSGMEERLVPQTDKEKAEDMLYKQTGGRLGKKYEPKMRTAHVIDIYQDWRFPDNNNAWFRGGEDNAGKSDLPYVAQWNRLQEYSLGVPYPSADVFSGAMTPTGGRVYQGALEDFYLIVALQTLGMKPKLIANVFCNMEFSDPQLGAYTLRFYKHGQWQHVDIDDSLPFDNTYNPMCCQSEYFPEYSWPALIEKAYAKMHGSWEALGGGGHVEEVLVDLTGGCATRYGTCDVASDRLFQYLYEMQRYCVFGCNLNEGECSKRNVPIEKHWASSIFRASKFNGIPYICVCCAAPSQTLRHMPYCEVPSPEGYGVHDGMVWLRLDDFVELFDTIYECRLVNSDLGSPATTGIPHSPGWMMGHPWFEDVWAYQGAVYTETAPSFMIECPQAPVEITMQVSQTDARYNEHDVEPAFGRGVQAPLLLRFYQCSREVDEMVGGEIYLVHFSAWGHTRDACTTVKVKRPGKYLAMVSLPAKYVCQRMIFRTYTSVPTLMKPILNHRAWVSVNPAMPLNAIPYCLCGFQRIDAVSEKFPQRFDEAEGRGKPMANGLRGSLTGFGTGYGNFFGMGMPHGSTSNTRDPHALTGWRADLKQVLSWVPTQTGQHEDGQKVLGKFGGKDAVATVEAKEIQAGCSLM